MSNEVSIVTVTEVLKSFFVSQAYPHYNNIILSTPSHFMVNKNRDTTLDVFHTPNAYNSGMENYGDRAISGPDF